LVECVDGGRYAVSALARPYAAARLAEDPTEAAATAARHAAFFAAAVDTGAAADAPPPVTPAGDGLAEQAEHLRAPWGWAAAHGRADVLERLRPGLVRLYDQRGAWAEATSCLGTAAERLRAALAGDAAGAGAPGAATERAGVLAACLVDLARFQIQRCQL